MNMRQKLRCILTIMGIITVCTACIVQKDPVDNSDDSGTKKKSFGKYDIMNEHNLGDNEQERMSGYNNAIVFVLSLINPIYEYELE